MKSRRNQHPQILELPSGYRAIYRDWGSGMPVIFLHGLMGNHRHWLGLMQNLKRYYRCIALDLLGFGESSQPRSFCGVAEEVEFVREVVQALELNDYIIVGHSFGGWIAATYAMDYQAEMRGMILAAPAGIGDRAFSRHYAYRLPLTWNVPWVDWGLTATSSILEFFGQQERLRSLLMERKALLAQPAARDFVRSRARGAGTGSVESDIHTIQIPTFIIAADRDRLIPLWHCETYAKLIPKAQLCILPDTSHRLPINHWRAMLPHLQNFTASLYPENETSL